MITIPRSLVRRLRLTFSRGLGLSVRSREPPIHFHARDGDLVLRAKHDLAAIEYLEPGKFPESSFALPFEALKQCEGTRTDPASFNPQDDDTVVVTWQDAGILQVAKFPCESIEADFPSIPDKMQSHGPELLAALKAAVDTTDGEVTRYAMNCLQLVPGKPGKNRSRIVATDGRQLLVESGFSFPWKGEVLIPASRVFACRDLDGEGPVEIGRTEDWVTIRTGNWTIHLRIEKEGRFPRVDDHIPRVADAASTLRVSEADAAFFMEAVKHLPAEKEPSAPVTMDLNGHVTVRAKAEDDSCPTELVLTGSAYEGQRIRFNTNRKFLARALSLGFRDVHLFGPETPAYCRDERRSYVWALLGQEGAIKPQEGVTRIEPPDREEPAASICKNMRKQNTAMPKTANTTNGHASRADDQAESQNASLLEQAEALRDTLSEALSQTRELTAALKKQKKQTRLVQSTLQSLRALQSIDA